MIRLSIFSFMIFALACSSSESDDTPETASGAPSKAEITALIATGTYTSWTGDSAVHADAGPHGQVKSFINSTLESSIAAGNTTHTKGSISVKELYDSAGTTLTGYAYYEKITDGTDKNSWVWYEDLDSTNEAVNFYGIGLSTCVGCHKCRNGLRNLYALV